MFDAHRALIAGALQDAEEFGPVDGSEAWQAIVPPIYVSVNRERPPAADYVPADFGVLEMHVVDLVDEFARGLDGVHHLPNQVRRIVLQADVWGVAEAFEQRFETRWAHRQVGATGPRLPQNLHVVLLAGREILFVVDANDVVDLGLERLLRVLARTCSDVRDTQLTRQLDGFQEIVVILGALRGVTGDMVLRQLE